MGWEGHHPRSTTPEAGHTSGKKHDEQTPQIMQESVERSVAQREEKKHSPEDDR